MKVNRNIFREYDIRGIYGSDLTLELAYHAGRAFGTVLNSKYIKSVIVGYDNRESSPLIAAKLIDGLVTSGINVVNTGFALTPEIAFFTCTQGFDSGISVTASHNPKEFNGIKFYLKDAVPFFGSSLTKLSELMELEDYVLGEARKVSVDYGDQYIAEFLSRFKYKKSVKVVVSSRNGTPGKFLKQIFDNLGHTVTELDCELDQNFPKGAPNPEDPMYLAEVSAKVLESSSDVGFAFDTDGDRVAVCDEKGVFYETDKLLMLLSTYLLKSTPGAKIIYDVKSSENLKELIENSGGIPKMVKTGRTVFSEELRGGAILGAEYAGHIFYGKEFFGIDDAIYTSCKVLEILDTSGKSLSELFFDYKKMYHTTEIKIPCSDSNKFEVIQKVKKSIVSDPLFTDHLDIDGARAYLSDRSWMLVRVSNTSPYLTTRIEALTESSFKVLKEKLIQILAQNNLDTDLLDKVRVIYS